LTWSDIEQKFMDCAAHGGIPPKQASEGFAAIRRLDDCQDLNAIIALLTKSAS